MYKFDPKLHGFEPIKNYPELGFNYPISDNVYVKIVTYDNYGDLVYWYNVITVLTYDDRINISSGVYDFRLPSEFDKQSTPNRVYLGLISNDEYAEMLIKHLLGTIRNDSLNETSIQRYNENLGIQMRTEFAQHYTV